MPFIPATVDSPESMCRVLANHVPTIGTFAALQVFDAEPEQSMSAWMLSSGAKFVMLNAQKIVLILGASDSLRKVVGAGEEADQQEDQRAGGADGGQRVVTQKVADDQGVGGVVQVADHGVGLGLHHDVRTVGGQFGVEFVAHVEYHAEHGYAHRGGQADGDGDEQSAFELPAERSHDHSYEEHDGSSLTGSAPTGRRALRSG